MRFLVYWKESGGYELATRLKEEGAEVVVTRDGHPIGPSLALIEKKKDIIIFDSAGHGRLGDTLVIAGYNVLFASNFADILENNAVHAQSVCHNSGIPTEEVAGQEVRIELWFQRGEPIYPANSTLTAVKSLIDYSDCKSSVVFAYKEKEPRILGQTLKKLFLLFKTAKYTGPISMRCVIGEDLKAHMVSIKTSIRWDAFFAFASLLQKPLKDFFYDLSLGSLGKIEMDCDAFGYSMVLKNGQIEPILQVSGKGATIKDAEEAAMDKFRASGSKLFKDYGWLGAHGFITSGSGRQNGREPVSKV